MNLQYFYNIPFFSNLSEETLKQIMVVFEQVTLKKGDSVISLGDAAEGMYVIIAGEVEIVFNGERIATLGKHEFFGELALITNEPRTAAVNVISDEFQAFYLTHDLFDSAKNEIGQDIKDEILRRIQENFDKTKKII